VTFLFGIRNELPNCKGTLYLGCENFLAGHPRKMKMGNEDNKSEKKPYEKPTATKLTRAQTKFKLMREAMMGSEEAKELLDTLFDNAQQTNNPSRHKKSA
jgi:hypothetical protein